MSPAEHRPTPRVVYALLIDSLDDEHEVGVVRGALSAAREMNATLLCIAGAPVAHPDPDQACQNFVFDLARSDGVRGAIVLSSGLGNGVGPGTLAKWLTRFEGMAVCCVGVKIEGYPSVCIDNTAGVRETVQHLVRAHGKRAIGFIRGPAASAEAEERLEAYRNALRSEGIEPEARWVVDGDFEKPSGVQAVRTLLDQRHLSAHTLGALVAANDFMAMGALEELFRRGVQVPEQMAVVGFDDVASASIARPALTTVHQPAEALGHTSLTVMRAMSERRQFATSTVLPTEVVLRRSCGCVATDLAIAATAQLPFGGASVDASFVQRRQIMTAEMARSARGRLGGAGPGWESRLIEALLSELRGEGAGRFSAKLRQLLQAVEHAGGDPAAAHNVIAVLRRHALPCVTADATARDRLEEALHDAQVVVGTLAIDAAVARVRQRVARFRALARKAQAAAFRDVSQLADVLAAHLPAFGVEACLVAEIVTPTEPCGNGVVRFGFGPGGQRVTHEPCRLPSLVQHPAFENTSGTFFLLPVVLGTKPVGVALLAMAAVDGRMLEDLRDLFGSLLSVSALSRA
ncbi:MAG TPA: substrate-binding domain-containing protein [Polyangiaceae bacterium]